MFRKKIQDKYDQLTPSFRRLADFVLQNQLDAAFMTATELADRLQVDAATVVRFAQELGYSGFRELSKEIQDVVRSELKASYTTGLDSSDDVELYRALLGNEKHNLELAQDRLSEGVQGLLTTLVQADHVWVVGEGLCRHLAGLCAGGLRQLGLPAICITADPLEAAGNLKEIGRNDMVIGFSLSGMDVDTAGVVRFSRQKGAATYVLATSSVAAAALEAEVSIVCPGTTQTDIASFTGLAAMIVVLMSAFAARHPEEAEAVSEAMRQSYGQLLAMQTEIASGFDVEELGKQA